MSKIGIAKFKWDEKELSTVNLKGIQTLPDDNLSNPYTLHFSFFAL